MGRELASYDDISYTYDENGMRASKTVNGKTTKYYYDGNRLMHIGNGSRSVTLIYDRFDEAIGFFYCGQIFYYVKNLQGDITALISDEGFLMAKYVYDDWGNCTVITSSGTSLNDVANVNPLRYRGYVYDNDTGLYYLQSRYYDPEVGRFINCDDVNYIGITESEVSYNPFAYCGNDPVNYSDPEGNISAKDFLDVLKKAIDAIRDIIEYISNSYRSQLQSLNNSLKKLTKKQFRTKKNIKALIEQCDSISKKLGKIGRFITATTVIVILSTVITKPKDFPNLLTSFLIEKVIDFFVYGITEIIKRLPRAIPGVGYLAGVIISIVAEVVMATYFTDERVDRIVQKFVPYFKKITGKITVGKILSTGFKAIYA